MSLLSPIRTALAPLQDAPLCLKYIVYLLHVYIVCVSEPRLHTSFYTCNCAYSYVAFCVWRGGGVVWGRGGGVVCAPEFVDFYTARSSSLRFIPGVIQTA